MANLFSDGFESGDFSAWSATALDGGDGSVSEAAKIHGNYGFSLLLNNVNWIYVTDTTPSNEKRYRNRFYIDTNALSITSGQNFSLLRGYDDSENHCMMEILKNVSGNYAIAVAIRNDAGTYTYTAYYTITDGEHYIEVDWKASSAPGANDGFIELLIDGVSKETISNIDNDTREIDKIYWGALQSTYIASGTFYLDDFASNNDGTPIGAAGGTLYQATHTGAMTFSGTLNQKPKCIKTGGLSFVGSLNKTTKKIHSGSIIPGGSGKWSGLGMNIFPSDDEYIDFVLANGFTEVRHLIPYNNSSQLATSKAKVIEWVAKGAHVIWGVSSAGTTLTAANWSTYSDAVLAAAAWAQANGVFEFQLGNEEEDDIDGTTLTIAGLIANLKTLATAVQAVFTNGNISYSFLDSYDENWRQAGKGDIDIMASNLYLGGTEDFSDYYLTIIQNCIDSFGINGFYLSEFSLSWAGLDYYSADEAVQAARIAQMISDIQDAGITRALFFDFIDDVGENFGAFKIDGNPRQLWYVLIGSTSLTKKILKITAGAISFIGTLNKTIKQIHSGSITPSGSLTKKVSQILTGAMSFIGILTRTSAAIYHAIHEGAMTFVGTLNKKVSKVNAGVFIATGELKKTVRHILVGAVTFIGTLSAAKYLLYKITAITIKCGTAITDKLKLRRIK